MSKFSNYSEEKIIEAILRGASFPVTAGIYIALATADITDANVTANEVQTAAWPAYARQDCAAGVGGPASGWSANADGVSANAKVLTFPANNGAGPITITHIGIYDGATVGNLLFHAQLVSPKTLQVSDVLSFGIGALTVTVS